jgi:phospho-N-acetylmuramoyl-pentapeptide-transferase
VFPELLYPLTKYFTPFNIFQYITFRAAYAAVTSLLIAFIFGPRIIQRLRKMKVGEEIRSDGPESHQAKKGTPTMGGIMIVFSIIVSILLWQDIRNLYTWVAVLATFGFGAIGFVDDYLKLNRQNSDGLRAWVKFSSQIGLSLAIVLILYFNRTDTTTLLYLPFIKRPVLDLSVFFIPLATFFIVGTSNAVNLTDGLDGLASGLVILVGIALGLLTYLTNRIDFAEYLQIPYLENTGELTILCLAIVGSCVGFLWFNAHPAEVMMGDTGSLALGGVIGVISLIIKKELLLFIIGGVFVMEVFSVVIQVISYKTRKKRVFRMAPLHHHFELMGWSENKVVVRFWIIGGLFAILSLSTLKLR